MADDVVAAVRAFNRFYTKRIGVLRQGYLGTRRTLTEARVVYELAQHPELEVAELRRELDIDRGQLSRVLARLEGAGVLRRERSFHDGRAQVARLTANGRRAFATLDTRSAAETATLLEDLGEPDRRRLVAAMDAIRAVLGEDGLVPTVELRPPRPGDLGWIVERHGALYAQEYHWDASFEALVAQIVAGYAAGHDPEREAVWIADAGGERLGCVMCVKKTRDTAQLRLLLVVPHGRAMGIGARLIDECLIFAREAGYRRIMLWTNDPLVAARRLYERAGFTLTSEGNHRSFGHDLVEQTWQLEL